MGNNPLPPARLCRWSERAKQLYVAGMIDAEQLAEMQGEVLAHGDPLWDGRDGLPPWRIRYGGVWRDAGLSPA